jgi:hypothetical protein
VARAHRPAPLSSAALKARAGNVDLSQVTVSSYRDDDIRALLAGEDTHPAPEAEAAVQDEPAPGHDAVEAADMPALPPRPQFFGSAHANVYAELAELDDEPTVPAVPVAVPEVDAITETAVVPAVAAASDAPAPPAVDDAAVKDEVADELTAVHELTDVTDWAGPRIETPSAWRREDDDIIPSGGRSGRKSRATRARKVGHKPGLNPGRKGRLSMSLRLRRKPSEV